jgi:transcriptional regulator of acetoin/glycerol metabolism
MNPEPIQSLKKVIREHVLKVWAEHGGNVTTVAQALGIGRSTLYRYLRDFREPTWKDKKKNE